MMPGKYKIELPIYCQSRRFVVYLAGLAFHPMTVLIGLCGSFFFDYCFFGSRIDKKIEDFIH